MLKVKLLARGKSLTPYVSSVQTNGKRQKDFAERYGKPIGACVKGAVHKGMAQKEIRNAVRDCAKGRGG